MWNRIIKNTFVLMDKYREFLRTVQFLWFTKIVLSLVSISAGYFFVYSLFIKLFYLPKLAGLFSIIILSALEAINFYLPMKYYKFAMNPLEELQQHNYFNIKKVKRFLLFSALFGFGVSFYLSAQGAKYFLNHSADQTKEIAEWYKSAKNEIDTRYENLISNLQAEKQNIQDNPTIYKAGGHQPTMLSSEQLQQIADINMQLIALDKQRTTELSALKDEYKQKLQKNNKEITKVGWKYFIFAGFLILTLNIVNYFIVYFSKVIKLAQDENIEFKKVHEWKEALKRHAFEMAEDDMQVSLGNFQAVTNQTSAERPKDALNVQDYDMGVPEQSVENYIEDLNYDKVLDIYKDNEYAYNLLQKYPEASKILLEREKAKRAGQPQTTIKEVSQITGVGKTTLYKILTILNFK